MGVRQVLLRLLQQKKIKNNNKFLKKEAVKSTTAKNTKITQIDNKHMGNTTKSWK